MLVSVHAQALSVTLSTSTAVPVAVNTPMVWTASASGSSAVEYQFWVLANGSWSNTPYSASATFTFTPTRIGTYSVQVWVRSIGSTSAYQAWAWSGMFQSASAPLTVVALQVSPASPIPDNTPFTLSALTTGGAGPLEYQVWIQRNGVWTSTAYGPSSSYTDPVPLAGAYNTQVWVRNVGSTAPYESWRGLQFDVQAGDFSPEQFGAVCDGVTDDTVGIRNALAYVASRGGGTLRFSAMCGISASLTIPASGIALVGAGRGTGLRYVGQTSQPGAMLSVATSLTNVRIQRLELIAGDGTLAGSFGYVMHWRYASSSLIEDNYLSGFSIHGINLSNGVVGTLVARNLIASPAVDAARIPFVTGIVLESAITGVDNCHHTDESTPCVPQPATNANNTLLQNTITNGHYGILLENVAGGIVDSNTISSQLYRGIYLGFDSYGGRVVGNRVSNSGSTNMVATSGVHDFDVRFNVFDGAADYEATNVEIYNDVENVTLYENEMHRSGRYGIMVGYYARRIEIRSNYVSTQSTQFGIGIVGAMAWNYASVPVRSGYAPVGVYDVTITQNYISGPSAECLVCVVAYTPGTVQGNVPVRRVSITGNTLVGGDYGIALRRNPVDATAVSEVNQSGNAFSSQRVATIFSDL